MAAPPAGPGGAEAPGTTLRDHFIVTHRGGGRSVRPQAGPSPTSRSLNRFVPLSFTYSGPCSNGCQRAGTAGRPSLRPCLWRPPALPCGARVVCRPRRSRDSRPLSDAVPALPDKSAGTRGPWRACLLPSRVSSGPPTECTFGQCIPEHNSKCALNSIFCLTQNTSI